MSDVLGIDVSKWQREMDWPTAKKAGAQFAIIRAGSINSVTGQCYEDYQFIRNSGLAPEYMPFIAYYWYFRPQWGPKKQADYFCTLTEGAFRNLRLVADVETDGNLSDYHAGESVQIFCERIRENVGQDPTMYTRAYFFNSEIEERPLWPKLDLWIARYTSRPEPWGNPGDSPLIVPRDWADWDFWQWSADRNGRGAEFGAKSASIDLDYFNGDIDALAAYSEYLFPGEIDEHVYVSREGGTILYDAHDLTHYENILPYQLPMVADGIFVNPSDNREYLVVGDHLVLKAHCSPLGAD